MASCSRSCTHSLVPSKSWPRRSEPGGGIASRSRTQKRIPIVAKGEQKLLREAQLDDHHCWRTRRGTQSNTIRVLKKDTKLRAEVEDWKTSGSSSDVLNAQLARDDLLGLIAGEERGLRTRKNARKRGEIIKAIDALAVLGAGSVTTDGALSAAWRMLWTTERETLFIVEKAHLFGTEAGDILQVIDVARRSLNNVIAFPPTGMFLVNSTIDVVSAQRVNFKFTSASLRVGDWQIPFPPFGQGWFESVYLDDKIRVAKDIRGDYLVVDRAPSVPDLS